MFEDSVTVVLDKERHLKVTLGGMKEFRKATGIDLLKGAKELTEFTDEQIIAFIWACLLPEDRKLTLEDVGFMLGADKLKGIAEKMIEAWNISMPENEGSPDPNP